MKHWKHLKDFIMPSYFTDMLTKHKLDTLLLVLAGDTSSRYSQRHSYNWLIVLQEYRDVIERVMYADLKIEYFARCTRL